MAESTFQIGSGTKGFLGGYTDDALNASVNHLCPPSVNCTVTKNGEAITRGGYFDTAWDLDEAGKPATSFHLEQFNITFFALNTNIKYIDHNSSNAIVDTGVSITDATITRFEEYNGFVFATNQTDGCSAFLVTRLNGAVSAGAATIVTDIEGGTLANVFDTELSPGTKNLRISGTNEQYASVGAADGTFTLSGTASQAYSDNTIAIVVYDLDASNRVPKCAKLIAWKESLNAIGISVDDTNVSSDRRQTTMAFSQFALAATSENIVKFSGGTAGTELVGKSGKLVNAIATRDYLYLFKDTETYYIKFSDVNTTTGARPPQLISSNYGCKTADLAADMGDGTVAYVTQDNRIIAIKISTISGAPVVYPDESFDVPVKNLLALMDDDQANGHMFYDKANRMLYVQLSIDAQVVTLVYDNNIKKWTPPHTNKSFRSYFVKNGTLFSTDLNDDTVYEVGNSTEDNGISIECVMAGPQMQFQEGHASVDWREVGFTGSMTQEAAITLGNVVDDGSSQDKTFDSTDVGFEISEALGTVALGTSTLGGSIEAAEMGEWSKRFGIYPSYGFRYQWRLSSLGNNHNFSVKSYIVNGAALSEPILTLQ